MQKKTWAFKLTAQEVSEFYEGFPCAFFELTVCSSTWQEIHRTERV